MASLSENNISMQDSSVGLYGDGSFDYYSLNFDYFYFKNPLKDPAFGTPSSYFALYIVQSEANFMETRTLFNIISVLSDLGGLMGVLTSLFGVIVAGTSNFYFYQRLFEDLLLEE